MKSTGELMESDSGRRHLTLMMLAIVTLAFASTAPEFLMSVGYRCPLQVISGLRCPFCGMTRDFILLAHGFRPNHNPGSLPIAVLLYVIYPVAVITAVCRKCIFSLSSTLMRAALITTAVILMVLNNIWR